MEQQHEQFNFKPSDFPRLAALSASQYLTFLNENKQFAGMKIVDVYAIISTQEKTKYTLALSERIVSTEYCQIWVNGVHEDHIRILASSSKGRPPALYIQDERSCSEKLSDLDPTKIKVVSDMRFLVKRILTFYSGGAPFFRERKFTELLPLPSDLLEGLSDEQLDAVLNIPKYPVSYVSGAPGTGKTQKVLCLSVMQYILEQKRVILMAPTNNAVDQMLYGVLPVLAEAGINLKLVYRAGIPSDKFAEKYPQVIGDPDAERVLANYKEKLRIAEDERKTAAKILRNLEFAEKKLQECRNLHNKAHPLIQSIAHYQTELLQRTNALDLEQKEREYNASAALSLQSQIVSLQSEVNARERLIKQNDKLSQKLSYVLFRRNDRKLILSENSRLSTDLTTLRIEQAKIEQAIEDTSSELVELSNSLIEHSAAIAECRAKMDSLISELYEITMLDGEYRRILTEAMRTEPFSTQSIDEYIDSLAKNVEIIKADSEYHSLEKAQANIDELKNLIANARLTEHEKSALVIAGTIDSTMGYMLDNNSPFPEKPVCHVFVDEAGYTSIIRGMIPFFSEAPITFLGDHKQLEPVCAMNEIKIENAPVCLWALPVTYYPELLHGSLGKLFEENYCRGAEPTFKGIRYFPLSTSYRFGPVLAQILEKHIYGNGFTGASKSSFEILILDAKYRPGEYSRSNLAEVEAISHIIARYSPDETAILTPYRGQVRLLRNKLPKEYKHSVMTVHSSQGQEWDTVIFSAVDANNPYFVDSTRPEGRHVINAAISRAKRRLILTCDVDLWEKRPKQIIADIIKSGKRI